MFQVLTERKKKSADSLPAAFSGLPSIGKGQVILEFTFCMIIVLLIIFGITKVFIWSGREYAGRSAAHDSALLLSIDPNYGDCNEYGPIVNGVTPCLDWSDAGDGPLRQINPYFYAPGKMNAIWKGN